MSPPGRKPIPTHLKLLRGNPGHREINKSEPKPDAFSAQPAPDWFDDYARQEWERRAAQLARIGVLSELDDGALTALCVAWSRWMKAEDALSKFAAKDRVTHGLMVKTTGKVDKDGNQSGGNAIQNPLVGTANTAMANYVKLAVEFGMTPSSRARVTTGKDDSGNPYAKFGAAAGAA